MKKHAVYIHTNRKQMLGARLAAFSMKSRSKSPERFDVKILCAEDNDLLQSFHGEYYLREGKRVRWDIHDLQSFTPLRFLPPQANGFEGRAVITDPDVFAVGDVADLLDRDMKGKSILCKTVPATASRPAYFATSVMLLDCAKLVHWRWEEQLRAMFAEKIDYRDWMSLRLEDPRTIGEMEPEWNDFDKLTQQTRLLHNTGRLTQPWKTGLPVDFVSSALPKASDRKWGLLPRSWIWKAKSALKGNAYLPPNRYQKHPDPNQERFFLELLREGLETGAVSEDFLVAEVEANHVRKDVFDALEASGGFA
ncbi:MAG: hypothetical protein KDD51_15485 [Bdellovibrionales bacterium]|nr:hypothetical protein [Bdellovibrionales bacterium]